ncbi:MAG: hypothetical protein OEV35_06215, partial [Gallionellaceae bacterium]|nr:hypothetical protein [Gallionellaceae bacterium]
MLTANQLNALKALALEQKPLITVTALSATKAAAFEPGQKFQGTVQTQVAQGVFKVHVAGQVIQMQLPATIRSGDTIALQVISNQPRLVFSMSASTNPLSTPEQLSGASRLLSALSQQQPDKAYVGAAQKTPLWPAIQAPDGKRMATALREALGHSGLFYESHQMQWLQGSRSTEQLLQEPQNRLSGHAPPVVAEEVADRSVSSSSQQRAAPLLHDTSVPEIPEHLQPLVQQQLNALETRQMVWQGLIWPGQVMQWEIHEREQSAQDREAEEQRQWATTINLNLPRLGGVSAKLNFSSNGLSL